MAALKPPKIDSNKEASRKVRLNHTNLFPRKLSPFYTCMDFYSGTSNIKIYMRFLRSLKMMGLNMIINFLRKILWMYMNCYCSKVGRRI